MQLRSFAALASYPSRDGLLPHRKSPPPASLPPKIQILAKAEFSNPGGSVKDRVAAAILGEATKTTTRGGVGEAGAGAGASAPPSLRPGGLVAEGTAGSTGVSLAMLSPCFGVRAAVWMPDDAAEEKSVMVRGGEGGEEEERVEVSFCLQ